MAQPMKVRMLHGARKLDVRAINTQHFQHRIRAAIADEARYWTKVEAAEAATEGREAM